MEEHHAHSTEEIFDAISYKKGSTVIRMLQGYLGADMFQVRLFIFLISRVGCFYMEHQTITSYFLGKTSMWMLLLCFI